MTKMIQPEQIQLSNGIPVILQHYEGAVAATYWWINTGSADENPNEAGFAHFLEHMLFKDAAAKESGKASTGKMARTIESLGGDINAYTSFDQTVYHVTCAAQHWEKVLAAFGTMAKPQKFLTKDFEREREVILEELRKNEDSPNRQVFQSLFSTTFSKHPYGKPVIGYTKTLNAATTSQLEKFYKNNYISERMGLILVGPIEEKTGARKKSLIKLLETYYGKTVLKPKTHPRKTRPTEVETREESQWVVKPFDVKTPTLTVSFRVPELGHEDLPALDILTSVLSMGELSRLYRRLFYQTSLVTDISGGTYVPKDPGMIYFQVELDSVEKINSAGEELFKEIRRITDEGPTQEELSRVLTNAESERMYASQSVDGMAGRLGFLKFIIGDLHYDQDYLEDLKSVDAFQLKEVAKKYFDFRRMSGVVLVPKAQSEWDASSLISSASQILNQAPELVQEPALVTKPSKKKDASSPVEFFSLPSGLQVCFHPRPASQVFSIHASVLGGLRLEIAHPIERAEADWGASYMMALTWAKGTSKKDAKQIAAITEGKAASIDGFAGRNSVGLQLTGLSKDWGTLSNLFTEVLLDPSFPKDEVDHARRIAEDSVRGLEDHSSSLCTKLFLETLFETHPYGRMTHGSFESLQLIRQEKLRAFHRGWIRPERLVISVSGAVRRNHLESWIQDLERQALASIGFVAPFSLPLQIQQEPHLKAPRWVERPLNREQCHIIIGGLGTEIRASDRHTVRLLQTLLGGQSGRLFIELREKRSLAYTVSPMSFEGLEKGYIGSYIACSPQKREEAVEGIRIILENLAKKGPTPQEMNRTKEFFLGRRAMDLQGDSALAAHYGLEALYHIPYLNEQELIKKVNSISAREIQQACKKYLVDPFMVTSIVG